MWADLIADLAEHMRRILAHDPPDQFEDAANATWLIDGDVYPTLRDIKRKLRDAGLELGRDYVTREDTT
jgi:hypothetical protein